jgi:hypothetical protein
MRSWGHRGGLVGAAVLVAAFQAPPQKFVPDPVQGSDLTVRLDLVGAIPTRINPTSPAVAGSSLLLIDQAGSVYVWNGTRADTLLSKSNLPPGVKLEGYEPIINVAANKSGTTVYVMFISSTVPKDVPKRMSPHDESLAWYLLYAFDFDGTSLSHPRAVTAMQERVDGHSGGGLTVLSDDSVLFAAGDNGDSYEDGGAFSQDPSNHLAKLVRIDPATGQTQIVAVGVRACQRLTLDTFDGDARVTFVDPGGWVSEELDSSRVADLLGPAPVNFGWGRSPRDGKSREGSFYLDKLGNSTAKAPADEPGFISPIAEVGREQSPVFAVSGPVHSTTSFSRITFLFADLVGGAAFATTGPPTVFHQPVMSVKLIDSGMQAITFKGLAGGARPDPRFFNFPDGTAGVLLERTGNFYRLTEIKP